MPSQQLKTIHYRDSLVLFEVPVGWAEEYDHDGGSTFYPVDDESVTLRLNV
jgi:hypothetical protein